MHYLHRIWCVMKLLVQEQYTQRQKKSQTAKTTTNNDSLKLIWWWYDDAIYCIKWRIPHALIRRLMVVSSECSRPSSSFTSLADILRLFCTALSINLSSLSVVFFFGPPPCLISYKPVSLYRLQISSCRRRDVHFHCNTFQGCSCSAGCYNARSLGDI